MGRCPVRGVFAEALAVLEEKQHAFGYVRTRWLDETRQVRDCD